jgi:hypothetical protein
MSSPCDVDFLKWNDTFRDVINPAFNKVILTAGPEIFSLLGAVLIFSTRVLFSEAKTGDGRRSHGLRPRTLNLTSLSNFIISALRPLPMFTNLTPIPVAILFFCNSSSFWIANTFQNRRR